MCIYAEERVRTEKELRAFKLVHLSGKSFISLYAPYSRIAQPFTDSEGDTKIYRVGRDECTEGLGMCCYLDLETCSYDIPIWGNIYLLDCRIPEGTKIRYGQYYPQDIATPRLKVVSAHKLIRGKGCAAVQINMWIPKEPKGVVQVGFSPEELGDSYPPEELEEKKVTIRDTWMDHRGQLFLKDFPLRG